MVYFLKLYVYVKFEVLILLYDLFCWRLSEDGDLSVKRVGEFMFMEYNL
jgi:hypothetical protein